MDKNLHDVTHSTRALPSDISSARGVPYLRWSSPNCPCVLNSPPPWSEPLQPPAVPGKPWCRARSGGSARLGRLLIPELCFLLAGGVALEGFLSPEVADCLSRPRTIQGGVAGGVAKSVTRGGPILECRRSVKGCMVRGGRRRRAAPTGGQPKLMRTIATDLFQNTFIHCQKPGTLELFYNPRWNNARDYLCIFVAAYL